MNMQTARIGLLHLCGLLLVAALLAPMGAAAQTTVKYIHTDALGSVVAMTNATGTVIEGRREYEAYGQQLTPAVQDGPGYTGHVQDAATGLTYMQQRYYDPQLGVFLSVDPVTAYSSPVMQFHRYRYANNNPYRFSDPDGRQSCEDKGCPIFGKAQVTGTEGHAPAGDADAKRMAASGEYKSVHLDQKLSTITGDPAAGQQRPDVAGVRKDTGGVDTVEHNSKSQSVASQDAKGAQMQQKLEGIGKGGTHSTRTIPSVLKGVSGKLGPAGMVLAIGLGVSQFAQDPTRDNAGRVAEDVITGALCAPMGGCGDAQ